MKSTSISTKGEVDSRRSLHRLLNGGQIPVLWGTRVICSYLPVVSNFILVTMVLLFSRAIVEI